MKTARMKVTPLRAAVMARYKNVSAFAEDIGWTYNKTFRVVNGMTAPSIGDADLIAAKLNLNGNEIINIFFPLVSTNGNLMGA